VPSDRMLTEILQIINLDSIETFWRWHEKTINNLKQYGHPHYSFISPAENHLCILMGFAMQVYKRHDVINIYCKSLFINEVISFSKAKEYAELDRSFVNKLLVLQSSLAKVFSEGSAVFPGLNASDFDCTKYSPNINQISEYRESIEILWEFWRAVLTSAEDPRIQNLLREHYQRLFEVAETLAKLRHVKESKTQTHFICPFCRNMIFFEKSKGKKMPATCGSDTCQRVYGRSKPSKKTRSKKPEGWNPERRGSGIICKKCRKPKRVLNAESLCKGCFREGVNFC
ncbi:MAG: hypothetical protein WCD18_26075, partial [Thermosynechococcaceae cyanobacterium]